MERIKTLTPINYNFSSVRDISLSQLQQHYELYKRYVNQFNEMNAMPRDASAYPRPNTTNSPMRNLKKGETYALDGLKLHELYFENMTNPGGAPSSEMINIINSFFNSYENFIAYIRNAALSMRGWVVVTMDPRTEELQVIGQDAHDDGPIWLSYPLLVMDVYEHAYMIDFGIDRNAYIDAFLKNINWKVVNDRLRKYQAMRNAESYRFL
ncbi:superoxide dismutase [Alloiococcus sp. CFN-8]|uniref:superoxide dismutase n=1 Tax=Alloiococcus sp. CFN-8 TaxID=3416081 RepID=UPI003CF734FF